MAMVPKNFMSRHPIATAPVACLSRAQWLATLKALEDRKRAVVALTLKDTSEKSARTLKAFFAETAKRVRRRLN